MKLWKAIVKVELVIASEEEPTLYEFFDYASEELDNTGDLVQIKEIASAADIPGGWKNAIPYGDQEGDATCADILKEQLT